MSSLFPTFRHAEIGRRDGTWESFTGRRNGRPARGRTHPIVRPAHAPEGGRVRFLCLAYEEEAVLNGLSRDEWHVLRQETLDYVELLLERGILLDALPLQSATKAATVQVRGGRLSVTDGPFVETKEQIGGFFVIEVEDREAAVEIAAKWPSARLGTIEVHPIEPELRMEQRY